jgi:ADP-dependent NAD(P)H-hydrate dehydratase / NAD(P)H-hydrate epimerase
MQKLFDEVGTLDTRCYEKFHLSEDLLMEHAANGIATYIKTHFAKNSTLLFVCGSGNNGADLIACARILHQDYQVSLFFAKEPKSPLAQLQAKRAKALDVAIVEDINPCDVVIDGLVGTGFDGEFSPELLALMEKLNSIDAFKIACDIPSGMRQNGVCVPGCFEADVTLTMGALKKRLFLDEAKEKVGRIEVLDLGVSRTVYEGDTQWHLLDLEDLELPHRSMENTHKGSFGHLGVICGEKQGASILCGLAATRFGAGLVTLVGFEDISVPEILMYSHEIPSNASALALGMGMGEEFSDIELDQFLDNDLPLIADADIFHTPLILKILQKKQLVITPHPKEFVSLLRLMGLADIDVATLQSERFYYTELFCKNFPNVTLLLKGANVIIAKGEEFFINPHGTAVLAKGGSGDVLGGLIGALLAQGYTPLNAALFASLAHTKLALNYKGVSFSLTPYDLIDGIKDL